MRVRVTPSARAELLEAVARIQRRDREEAARFVLEVEERMVELEHGLDEVPELASSIHSATASHGHRLYLSERTNGMWLIAVWPDGELRKPE